MAGIGVKLKKIYGKNTIVTDVIGAGYSVVITIAPMFLVIGAVVLMQFLLGVSKISYYDRELYSSTVLYIFIFAMLTASPFNAVLSKYLSDIIYEEKYADILPCYYLGLIMNLVYSVIPGVLFCIHEYGTGLVPLYYVATGFFGYMGLVFVFYSMLYLSICKDYKKISLFFLVGMVVSVIMSLILDKFTGLDTCYGMLLSLTAGFVVIGSLEYALIRSYFRVSSGNYRAVFGYYRKNWRLVLTNFLYTLGMYVHNFVFWNTHLKLTVVDSFVCAPVYDMATCLAMFTNITASVIFISRVEMEFHEKYKSYSEAVIGGRGMDIRNSKSRMFEQLTDELMNIVRIQFIISIVLFFLCMFILPWLGMGGMVLMIYPCLTAGYFVLFIMYSAIIFLYYFNDQKGALLTSFCFAALTYACSVIATKLPVIWYGIGLVIGAFVGFSVAYMRLMKMEQTLDVHIFCKGHLIKMAEGEKPSNKVYDRNSRKGDKE